MKQINDFTPQELIRMADFKEWIERAEELKKLDCSDLNEMVIYKKHQNGSNNIKITFKSFEFISADATDKILDIIIDDLTEQFQAMAEGE